MNGEKILSKIVLGMSGGVDSTATAILLKDSGYEVIGVYMKLHQNENYHQENFSKAKKVADYLGIKIEFLDISKKFNSLVYEYFIKSYKDGLTPNPCVICNREIKFGVMVDFAENLGIEKISTGHYARSDENFIYKALDLEKDQSYFLSQISPKIVSRLLFPLGELYKNSVKEIVKDISILKDIATQKESSDICFVEGKYTDVLKKHINIDSTGEVVNREKKVVGSHSGYMHYTIGKRRGFRVDGALEPHYVLSIDAEKNQIVVGKKDELFVDEVNMVNVNLFEELKEFEAEIKIRYRTKGVKSMIKIENGNRAVAKLKEPVFGVAKGQFGVFYDGDKLLGGGVIV
jgi:tRNA-specific 2-thiouridylase